MPSPLCQRIVDRRTVKYPETSAKDPLNSISDEGCWSNLSPDNSSMLYLGEQSTQNTKEISRKFEDGALPSGGQNLLTATTFPIGNASMSNVLSLHSLDSKQGNVGHEYLKVQTLESDRDIVSNTIGDRERHSLQRKLKTEPCGSPVVPSLAGRCRVAGSPSGSAISSPAMEATNATAAARASASLHRIQHRKRYVLMDIEPTGRTAVGVTREGEIMSIRLPQFK